jgi:L-ascorbate metabolism protein UlaG (beta-lactamase superfamily)
MFEIEYKGGNTLTITTKKATIVVDPKLSVVGLKDLLIKDAVEIATEARFAINGTDAKLLIEGPGEYGVGDFDIKGIPAQRHLDTEITKVGTIYRIEIGEVRIALIGNVYEKLTDDELEEIGVIDIVILPVGGNGYTLDATGAVGIIRKIDPRLVIPVHYDDKALRYEVSQDTLDIFVKELGAPVETVAKYKSKGITSLPSVLTVLEISRS